MLASRKNELILGQTKLHLSSVDSTSNYAANLVKGGLCRHGTVILADEQTNGRGQRGAVWQSEPGMNLQMSLVLLPNQMEISAQRYLNSFVSIGIVKFLERHGVSAQIKWPNDILVNNRKIAGILIENQLKNGFIYSAIVGIGLNINQINFNDLSATSLRLETNLFTSLPDALDGLLFQLNMQYESFDLSRYTELEMLYFDNLWGFGEWKSFKDQYSVFLGKIVGVSVEGLLELETKDGLKKYGVKEVDFVLES